MDHHEAVLMFSVNDVMLCCESDLRLFFLHFHYQDLLLAMAKPFFYRDDYAILAFAILFFFELMSFCCSPAAPEGCAVPAEPVRTQHGNHGYGQ